MSAKTLDDALAQNDPAYVILSPRAIFERTLSKGTKRFIVTAAQNATPVEPTWWAVLQNVAKSLNAEILVIPIRYKNPTSQWSGSQSNAEYWDEPVRPYLWNVRKALNPNLTVLGDIKIQPTAGSPLTGAEALSLASSGIIGHTKLQMCTVPTPASRMAKVLTTTGAVTVPNYTDSRAGRIGEFHHSFSAVLAEIDGKRFHLRHLHFDGEGCIDLDTRYTAHTVEKAPPALALVMGDTHVRSIDPLVERATFGSGGIIETLRPERLVWHDLLDGYACNPHHRGDPFVAVAKAKGDGGDVRKEVEAAIEFVRKHTRDGIESIIVPSNHDAFLRRWISESDWKAAPHNAEFYLSTALEMVRNARLTEKGAEYPDPFCLHFAAAKVANARTLAQDESYLCAGIELGMHGDIGPNGARGSIRNLRRIGTKSIIGHAHSPGIDEGCYQVGTSTRLRLEYNHGASGWLNAHCVLTANGKRQIIVIVDGKWRL